LFGLAGKKDEFSRMGKKWVRVSTLYYTKGSNNTMQEDRSHFIWVSSYNYCRGWRNAYLWM